MEFVQLKENGTVSKQVKEIEENPLTNEYLLLIIRVKELKREIHEKNLIVLEMEKLILDLMNENKKVIDILDKESNPETIPNYFKCPISWEKMENPVITNEGHS